VAATRSALRTLALAEALALAVSMEYLFQPFVWRNWPVDEVLIGWLFVLFDRLWVAFAIAAGAWLALRASRELPLLARGAGFTAAVVAASIAAELALRWVDSQGAASDALDLTLRVVRWSLGALAVAGLLLAWRRTLEADEALRRAEQQRLAADTQLADLRMQALQSQIEPHFLFNTLATARRLGDTDPAQCARLLGHLHDFVRLTRAAAPGGLHWRLRDELEVVRAYLAVIELRMGGRLRLRYEIAPETDHCETPPLALATLVENAVKHGIAPSTEGGDITVSARREPAPVSARGGQLILRVADTGIGFAAASGGGSGIGLANTRARLLNRYGATAELELAANQPRGAVATIRMPALDA
jgi:signal transduction histidine kinase